MKIRGRIVLLTCTICIVSVLVVSLVNYNLNAKKLLNEMENNFKGVAEITTKEMDQWLGIQKNSLKEIAAALEYNGNIDFDYVHSYLEKQIKNNEGNVYYLGLPDGRAIFGIDYIPPADFDSTTRVWYQNALATDDVTVSSPYVDFRTGDVTITISKAIKKGGSLIGVIGSDIYINNLIEIISRLDLGESSYGFLVDGDGNIVTHINEEFNPDSEKGHTNISEILDGKLIELFNAEGGEKNKNQIIDYDGMERFFFVENMDESDWKFGVAISSDEILKPFTKSINIIILSAIIVIVITILISIFIGDSIAKPIKETVELANRIEKLDLTSNVDEKMLKKKDEIGEMSVSFQSIIDSLRDFSKMVGESSELVASSSEELTSISQQAASASTSIATSAVDIAVSSDNQLRDVLNVVSVIEEISAQIQEVAENVKEIDNLAKNVSINSDDGRVKIEGVISQMSNISESTEKVQSSLVDINNSSQEMDNIIQVIQVVAEQTNLLALNAAIEAARAGEYGSGFAVVADEIRNLAEQVQHSTKDIYEILEKNQDIINEANENMDLSRKEVNKGLLAIDETQNSFMNIIDSIEEITTQIQNIAMGISQVAGGAEDAVSSVNYIEDMSKEISSNIGNVSAATEEQTASMEEIASASESLAHLAEDLQSLIYQIKI